jgi:hypothetical protein
MENNQEDDKKLLREMFNDVRNAEIKNVKIQKYDDKQMAQRIAKYVIRKVGQVDEV